MKQYCRYCTWACDYNGEATDFICTAPAPCGNNEVGKFYDAAKAKRPNKCKHFDYVPMDVFYTTYGEREYKPRDEYRKRKAEIEAAGEQLKMESVK